MSTNYLPENKYFLYTLASLIVIIAGFIYAKALLSQVLLALFISMICAQPVKWLEKKKVPNAVAVVIVFVFIIGLFFGLSQIIGSSLSSFTENLPKYEKNINDMTGSLIVFLQNRGINLSSEQMMQIVDPSKIITVTVDLLGKLGNVMGNAFTIFFMVLFLLLEIDSIPVKVNAIMKDKKSNRTASFITTIVKSIRHYLNIKTQVSLLTGISIWIGLLILGVDYAIIWGLIAFLLNYIPNIGSIIAAIPAVLFALIQLGFGGALWTLGIYITVNMVIGNVIEPKITSSGMGLSTFIVFLGLLFWGMILGTVGMFLSVPLTMTIKIITQQNPETKWIAIFLGTQKEAEDILEEHTMT